MWLPTYILERSAVRKNGESPWTQREYRPNPVTGLCQKALPPDGKSWFITWTIGFALRGCEHIWHGDTSEPSSHSKGDTYSGHWLRNWRSQSAVPTDWRYVLPAASAIFHIEGQSLILGITVRRVAKRDFPFGTLRGIIARERQSVGYGTANRLDEHYRGWNPKPDLLVIQSSAECTRLTSRPAAPKRHLIVRIIEQICLAFCAESRNPPVAGRRLD